MEVESVLSEVGNDQTEAEDEYFLNLRSVKEIMRSIMTEGKIDLRTCIPQRPISARDAFDVGLWLISYKETSPVNAVKARFNFIIGLIKYKLVKSLAELEKLYGVLLNCIALDRYAPYACHLLSYLTGAHIRKWHVENVLLVIQRVGWLPHLSALFTRMKEVRPDLVWQSVPSKSISASFPSLPPAFEDQLQKVAEQLSNEKGDTVDWNAPVKAVLPRTKVSNRKAGSLIPANRYINLLPSVNVDFTKQVLLSQIRSMTELIEKTESLTLPNQISALLSCSEYRFVLLSRIHEENYHERLSRWIYTTLVHEFIEKDPYDNIEAKRELLMKIRKFQLMFGTPVDRVSFFLTEFLVEWDGVLYFDEIMGFIPYLPFSSFEDLHDNVLRHVEKIFYVASEESQCKTLSALIRLYANLISQQLGFPETAKRSLLQAKLSEESGMPVIDEEKVLETLSCVFLLAKFICRICTRVVSSSTSQTLLWITLMFSEQLIDIESTYGMPYRTVIPYALLYRGFMSPVPAIFSKACHIMCLLCGKIYKEFANAVTQAFLDVFRERGVQEMKVLDSYVIDSRNLLLDAKAFLAQEGSILAQETNVDLLRQLSDYGDFRSSFYILNHPAVFSCIYEYGKKLNLDDFSEVLRAANKNPAEFLRYAENELPGLIELIRMYTDGDD